MNDFGGYIRRNESGKFLTAADSRHLQIKARTWLAGKLAESFEGKTVVVTQHAPSLQSIPAQYISDRCTPAFASNLEDMVAQADLWIHGHTHNRLAYHVGKCRVVCSSRGYVRRSGEGEATGFEPTLIVEV